MRKTAKIKITTASSNQTIFTLIRENIKIGQEHPAAGKKIEGFGYKKVTTCNVAYIARTVPDNLVFTASTPFALNKFLSIYIQIF